MLYDKTKDQFPDLSILIWFDWCIDDGYFIVRLIADFNIQSEWNFNKFYFIFDAFRVNQSCKLLNTVCVIHKEIVMKESWVLLHKIITMFTFPLGMREQQQQQIEDWMIYTTTTCV